MNSIESFFTNKYTSDSRIKSVSILENPAALSALTDAFDVLLLVVTFNGEVEDGTFHYIKDNTRIQERWINSKGLDELIVSGENRNIIQWILQGVIIVDREGYMCQIRHQLLEFPQPLREKKLLTEFYMFLKSYLQSKQYLQEGHLLDANSNVLDALHHWVRIVIIEEGIHPEVTAWSQIRKINPEIYKLYQELILSNETLEQKVRLVLLACEFNMMSKMERCCAILMRILESREQAWSVMELYKHPDLQGMRVEIPLLLRKLVNRSLIKEVVAALNADFSIVELQYTNKAIV